MGTFEAIDGVMERLTKYLPWFVEMFVKVKQAKPHLSDAQAFAEVDDHVTPGRPNSDVLS